MKPIIGSYNSGFILPPELAISNLVEYKIAIVVIDVALRETPEATFLWGWTLLSI